MGGRTRDEDYIEHLFIASTHAYILIFTNTGRVYWLKVYQMPEAGPGARGKPIVNLLPLAEGEKVQALLPVRDYDPNCFVFFATRHGTVKKTPLTEFAFQLQKGKAAINLEEGDALVDVAMTDGESDVLLFASNGKSVRFDEGSVRSMGRTATGVRGMRLADDAEVVSMIVASGDGDILTATARGYGKRTALEEFPKKGRGTQGVIAIQCSERNGNLVSAAQVTEAQQLMLISDQGTLVRTRVSEVSQLSRNTQGVTLIKLATDETLVGLERVQEPSEEELDELIETDEEGAPLDAVGDDDAGTEEAPQE